MTTHYGEQVGTNQRLDKLNTEIEKLRDESKKSNSTIIWLTVAVLIVGIVTLLFTVL